MTAEGSKMQILLQETLRYGKASVLPRKYSSTSIGVLWRPPFLLHIALSMQNKSTISTLLPFQGVNGFTNDNPTQGAASLALTLKVQRAKHAINDNSHSYAVEEPLKPIRA